MSRFDDLINNDIPVLVDFYALWCAPCKMMPPILKEVKDKFGEQLRIIKIDTEKNQSLSAKYQIKSIPTIILFKNGKVKWQNSGVMQAKQLINTITNFIN